MKILIMTATITPPQNARSLSRIDPAARLADYLEALDYYTDLIHRGTLDKIVFTENSSSDLGSLIALSQRKGCRESVEFLSFWGLDYPPEYGRGYGEFKILDHAMENSEFVRAAPPSSIIWKITGRYKWSNLDEIARLTKPGHDVYCNCRNHPIPWTDLFALGWTKSGYKELLSGVYTKLDESNGNTSAEQHFRTHISDAKIADRISPRFPRPAAISGIRGLDGKSYEDMGFKYHLRRACSIVLPALWI